MRIYIPLVSCIVQYLDLSCMAIGVGQVSLSIKEYTTANRQQAVGDLRTPLGKPSQSQSRSHQQRFNYSETHQAY